jgi:transmembrane sensor
MSAMITDDERERHVIAEQAAAWFITNRAGPSPGERADFAAWLKASPIHVEEYLGLAVMANDLRDACVELAPSLDLLLAGTRPGEAEPVRRLWPRLPGNLDARSPPTYRGAAVLATIAMLSLALLGWWGARFAPRHPAPGTVTTLRFETRHGEQQTHRLPDNSVLHLNTDSTLTVSYSNSERIVMLSAGEAEFEVSHDARRPFRVFAGPAEMVDIGTQFDVRLEQDSTVVTVMEGKIAVGPASMRHEGGDSSHEPLARFVELAGDQQIRVAQGTWPAAPVLVDAHRTASWLRRQISFDHEPLGRVASEFNRYSAKPIEIDTPSLREMEISGVFATDDIDAFVAFLRSLDGVRVEVTATRIRVRRD